MSRRNAIELRVTGIKRTLRMFVKKRKLIVEFFQQDWGVIMILTITFTPKIG